MTSVRCKLKKAANRPVSLRAAIAAYRKGKKTQRTQCFISKTFIGILHSYKYFTIQLKNNTIHISQGDTVTLLENRKKALTELDQRTAESLRKLDEKALAVLHKLKQDVGELKDATLADVENAGTSLKQTLYEERRDAISEINTAGEQAKQDIAGKTSDGISEINTAGEHVKQYIAVAKHDIYGQKSEAVSDICNAKEDVLSAIAKAGAETKEDVLSGACGARSDMSGRVVSKSCKELQKEVRKEKVQELKDDLITWYNQTNQSTVYLSPLTDAFPTPLA
ncbi:uncharacterized protein LOC132751679, partial [Ruditapes philippinarum]|uniref:uncharacterized protein LOC132751679 n=1 Tax=Ruditapes philippinarum TaxID=129788 RepID=UPI00295AD596